MDRHLLGTWHTTTLLLIGIVIIALRLTIPDRLALLLEFFVGIMLIGLGVQAIYNFRKKRVHQHGHGHEENDHHHFHSHAQGRTMPRSTTRSGELANHF